MCVCINLDRVDLVRFCDKRYFFGKFRVKGEVSEYEKRKVDGFFGRFYLRFLFIVKFWNYIGAWRFCF